VAVGREWGGRLLPFWRSGLESNEIDDYLIGACDLYVDLFRYTQIGGAGRRDGGGGWWREDGGEGMVEARCRE
jgi:hypothetical protein